MRSREATCYLRARPAHEGVLPATAAWKDVPVDTPACGLAGAALRCAAGGLEDADGAVTELLCCAGRGAACGQGGRGKGA